VGKDRPDNSLVYKLGNDMQPVDPVENTSDVPIEFDNSRLDSSGEEPPEMTAT
jgi:hypothetical protein